MVTQQQVQLKDPKEIILNEETDHPMTIKVGKIPCLPGIDLLVECASVLEADHWSEINTHNLVKLAPYAAVVRDGVEYSLANKQAMLAFMSTDELWLTLLHVYAYNFDFFVNGGTLSIMRPLLRKETPQEKSNTEM